MFFFLLKRNLEQLINNGETYDSDDFAVVLQPFFTQTDVPRLVRERDEDCTKFHYDVIYVCVCVCVQPDGTPDDSYFAPDCFHFSQLGHGVVATYLWNNMVSPTR